MGEKKKKKFLLPGFGFHFFHKPDSPFPHTGKEILHFERQSFDLLTHKEWSTSDIPIYLPGGDDLTSPTQYSGLAHFPPKTKSRFGGLTLRSMANPNDTPVELPLAF